MMDREDRRPDLSVLDPGAGDAGYWPRLRAAVLAAAAYELARRRELARASVVAVLSGWSRRLIPATLAAAVAAGLLLFAENRGGGAGSGGGAASSFLALEDVLDDGAAGGLMWAAADESESPAAFMAFVEGHGR